MEELDQLIAEWTVTKQADELLDLMSNGGVPAGRIYRAKDMFTDPHFAARDAIVTVQHPVLGDFPMQNVFPKLSETPGKVRSVGPELGQHNEEIYTRLLGIDEDTVSSLRSAGVI
jgi:formyl-CoA transferase